MTEPPLLAVPVRLLHPLAVLPRYAYPADAGADLATVVAVQLAPGQRASVPTGVSLALPTGYAGFVHPRSGLARRHGIGIVNAPGTVDAGYRGEILVQLINLGQEPVSLAPGDRIAQLIVAPVAMASFMPVEALPESERGPAGHGSSGR